MWSDHRICCCEFPRFESWTGLVKRRMQMLNTSYQVSLLFCFCFYCFICRWISKNTSIKMHRNCTWDICKILVTRTWRSVTQNVPYLRYSWELVSDLSHMIKITLKKYYPNREKTEQCGGSCQKIDRLF